MPEQVVPEKLPGERILITFEMNDYNNYFSGEGWLLLLTTLCSISQQIS